MKIIIISGDNFTKKEFFDFIFRLHVKCINVNIQ